MKTIYKINLIGLSGVDTAKDIRPTILEQCNSCQPSKGSRNRISARIIASDDKQPLVGANILNLSAQKRKEASFGTISNEQGIFQLNAEPTDLIQISYIGFKTFVIKAEQVPLLVTMLSDVHQIEGTTVYGQSNDKKNTPSVVATTSFNGKLKKYSGLLWVAAIALGVALIANKTDKKNTSKS